MPCCLLHVGVGICAVVCGRQRWIILPALVVPPPPTVVTRMAALTRGPASPGDGPDATQPTLFRRNAGQRGTKRPVPSMYARYSSPREERRKDSSTLTR